MKGRAHVPRTPLGMEAGIPSPPSHHSSASIPSPIRIHPGTGKKQQLLPGHLQRKGKAPSPGLIYFKAAKEEAISSGALIAGNPPCPRGESLSFPMFKWVSPAWNGRVRSKVNPKLPSGRRGLGILTFNHAVTKGSQTCLIRQL